jgi:hypothetical protein
MMCNPSKYQERFFFSLSAKQSKYHLKIENSLVLSVCCVNKRKKLGNADGERMSGMLAGGMNCKEESICI